MIQIKHLLLLQLLIISILASSSYNTNKILQNAEVPVDPFFFC